MINEVSQTERRQATLGPNRALTRTSGSERCAARSWETSDTLVAAFLPRAKFDQGEKKRAGVSDPPQAVVATPLATGTRFTFRRAARKLRERSSGQRLARNAARGGETLWELITGYSEPKARPLSSFRAEFSTGGFRFRTTEVHSRRVRYVVPGQQLRREVSISPPSALEVLACIAFKRANQPRGPSTACRCDQRGWPKEGGENQERSLEIASQA